MDMVGEEQGRLARLARWLDASRVELVGLAVLLAGAVTATGALWWAGSGAATPAPPPPPALDTDGSVPDADDARSAGAGPGGAATAGAAGTSGGAGTSNTSGAAGGTSGTGDTGRAGTGGGPEREATGAVGQQAGEASLTVHVAGAVAEPGVVHLHEGARVADALEAAGGADDEADPQQLNLARPLTDGEQVHVPREGEEPRPAGTGPGGGERPVDLNRADVDALQELPGIGPALGEAIVEHRETHGPFREPGDLRDVPGIGEKTFQRLAGEVTVR